MSTEDAGGMTRVILAEEPNRPLQGSAGTLVHDCFSPAGRDMLCQAVARTTKSGAASLDRHQASARRIHVVCEDASWDKPRGNVPPPSPVPPPPSLPSPNAMRSSRLDPPNEAPPPRVCLSLGGAVGGTCSTATSPNEAGHSSPARCPARSSFLTPSASLVSVGSGRAMVAFAEEDAAPRSATSCAVLLRRRSNGPGQVVST